ncbi:MAG: cytochrome c-type biogenesis CcmF C-terminal domain-containing protein, partial [Paracoccaceae bacterium]|nr:cytochrome c-type biogenesis CcmF C-terminal domain-containing protein [Paracoccaceae bacterium]
LLAILAFGFSLIGTFIVRSGVITSVHAFANDPERGVFILMILGFFMGGALTLFAARASSMEAKGVFSLVSRESALVMNNILLAVSCFVVFIGTIWPLVAEMLFDRKLSVGPPFFDMAFTPFMVVLGAILPIGAMMPWKRAEIGRSLRPLIPAFILALSVAILAFALQTGRSAMGPVGLFLGTWLISGSVVDIWSRTGRGAVAGRLGRLTRLPRADWGKSVAHAGLGVTMLGISGVLAWQQEDIRVVQFNEPFDVAGFTLTLTDVQRVEGPNYISTMGWVDLARGDTAITTLNPEKRFYPVAEMPTTEAAIDIGFWRDVYVVIGDPQADGGWAIRTYYKPLANWIWGGTILMALGGMLSISDRRFRVAAGATRREPTAGVPAE